MRAGRAEHVGAREHAPQDVVEPLARERPAARVQDELRAAAALQQRPPPVGDVPAHGRRGRAAHGHHALLVALADAAHDPALEVHVAVAQAQQLAHAQPAAVEQLERGEVALPQGPGPHDRRQDVLDLLDGEDARQLLRPLGRAQQRRRVVLAHALAHQIGVEGAHRRRPARHAGRRAVAAGAGEVGADLRGRGAARLRAGCREGRRERGEVAAVGGHRVGAEAALVPHVVEELLDQRDRREVAEARPRPLRWPVTRRPGAATRPSRRRAPRPPPCRPARRGARGSCAPAASARSRSRRRA